MVLSKTPDVPHKGWNLHDVVDARDERGLEHGDYESCQFCGKEQIRWVHILQHPGYPNMIEVGCNCAEKLTNDYVNPKRREQELKSRSSRRVRFPAKGWKTSSKGNPYISHNGKVAVVFGTPSGKFRISIDKQIQPKAFSTIDEAKMGIFDIIEPK